MPRDKKPHQSIKPGTADLGTAILTGDAFFKLASKFIQSVTPDIQTAHHGAAQNIGDLIASATMLPLSIELYLKALLLKYDKPAPKTHELPVLYSALPQSIKHSCEERYESFRKTEGSGTASFKFQIFSRSKVPNPKWREDLPQDSLDYSLTAVLMRSSSAFVTWRYLFAINPQTTPEIMTYEFLRLSFAARSFRAELGTVSLNVATS